MPWYSRASSPGVQAFPPECCLTLHPMWQPKSLSIKQCEFISVSPTESHQGPQICLKEENCTSIFASGRISLSITGANWSSFWLLNCDPVDEGTGKVLLETPPAFHLYIFLELVRPSLQYLHQSSSLMLTYLRLMPNFSNCSKISEVGCMVLEIQTFRGFSQIL